MYANRSHQNWTSLSAPSSHRSFGHFVISQGTLASGNRGVEYVPDEDEAAGDGSGIDQGAEYR